MPLYHYLLFLFIEGIQFTNFIENNISHFDSRWKNNENISFCETDVFSFDCSRDEPSSSVTQRHVGHEK